MRLMKPRTIYLFGAHEPDPEPPLLTRAEVHQLQMHVGSVHEALRRVSDYLGALDARLSNAGQVHPFDDGDIPF